MKNKIQLIDVSILSSYMGRWLTLLSTLLVIGIAMSVVLGRGRGQHNIISVCVSAGVTTFDPARAFEPFRLMLGRETRRPVVVATAAEGWQQTQDLYVMTTAEFLANAERLQVEALYEVLDVERLNDKAVIVARTGDIDLANVAGDDIAFASPTSVNRFWVQASRLEAAGAAPIDAPRFAGGDLDASRVVFGVVFGAYRLGACRLSDIVGLTRRGLLDGGELVIVDKSEVLPEVIIAARRDDAEYYRSKLRGVAGRVSESASPFASNETVELFKSFGFKGLQPIDATRLERARELAANAAGTALQ